MLLKGTKIIRRLTGLHPTPLPAPPEGVLAWITEAVRTGGLSVPVRDFLTGQPEICDQAGIVVESVNAEWVCCAVPAVAEDGEAKSPFATEVRFKVQPAAGKVERLD